MNEYPPSTSAAVFKGVRRALPIVLGYVPIGFAYGVLAGKSGISATNTVLMSLIVFAGSAQFIAVGLFASGTGPAVVILTTFVVNLRHLLMAASLAPYLAKWSRRRQALFAYELTDETFALHSTTTRDLSTCPLEALSLNVTAQASWVLGSALGVVASNLIGDVKPLGLDYALSAMFIGLLVSQCTSLVRLATAPVAGATFGLAVEQWTRR